MRRTVLALATAAAAGTLLAAPALAQTAVCDPYTATCEGGGGAVPRVDRPGAVTEGPGAAQVDVPAATTGEGAAGTAPTASDDAPGATLPFTGGETLALGAGALAAVGAGTVLVVAGRRRRPAGV